MKTKQVWRYYCDHCKKSGGSKAAMAKHESICFYNPARICKFCDSMQIEQKPISELMDIFLAEGLAALRKHAENCPACINAAFCQETREIPYGKAWEYHFDCRAESKSIIDDIRAAEYEGVAYGEIY